MDKVTIIYSRAANTTRFLVPVNVICILKNTFNLRKKLFQFGKVRKLILKILLNIKLILKLIYQVATKCKSIEMKSPLFSVSAVGGHRVCPLLCSGQLLHPILHHGLRVHTYILCCQSSRTSRHPEAASSTCGAAGIARHQADQLHSKHTGNRR